MVAIGQLTRRMISSMASNRAAEHPQPNKVLTNPDAYRTEVVLHFGNVTGRIGECLQSATEIVHRHGKRSSIEEFTNMAEPRAMAK